MIPDSVMDIDTPALALLMMVPIGSSPISREQGIKLRVADPERMCTPTTCRGTTSKASSLWLGISENIRIQDTFGKINEGTPSFSATAASSISSLFRMATATGSTILAATIRAHARPLAPAPSGDAAAVGDTLFALWLGVQTSPAAMRARSIARSARVASGRMRLFMCHYGPNGRSPWGDHGRGRAQTVSTLARHDRTFVAIAKPATRYNRVSSSVAAGEHAGRAPATKDDERQCFPSKVPVRRPLTRKYRASRHKIDGNSRSRGGFCPRDIDAM